MQVLLTKFTKHIKQNKTTLFLIIMETEFTVVGADVNSARRPYHKPMMTVVELQHQTQLLQASRPDYYPENW